MPISNIVIGQKIDQVKIQRAKELRRCMTDAESVLWDALRNHKLDGLHFRRQQVIDGFIVDFYCHGARLVVEVDGDVHEGQADYDAERDQVFTGHGFDVLRIRNEEIEDDLTGVLERISQLAARNLTP